MNLPQDPPIRIFLNHRYRSSQVNLPMYDLMADGRRIQFEVDRRTKPTNTTATNITRLEVMMRKADAFVGILAFNGDPLDNPTADELRYQSRYFRLELDIAVRARKPCFVIADERFGSLVTAPSDVETVTFPMQDREGERVRQEILRLFDPFWRSVMTLTRSGEQTGRSLSSRVGYVIPDRIAEQMPDLPKKIESAVTDSVCEPVRLPWPPCMDTAFLREVRRCDWVIVECGVVQSAMVVGYLRGQAIPMLRTRFNGSSADPAETLDTWDYSLFGQLSAHYHKNLVVWDDASDLADKLRRQMRTIKTPATLIPDAEQATEYFRKAEIDAPHSRPRRRTEKVFVSYAKEDIAYAAALVVELREHFEDVFDYRADGSIPHGEDWLTFLLRRIEESAVGVPIVSRAYAASNYCTTESRRMADARIRQRMRVFPVMLDATRLDVMADTQYTKAAQKSVEDIARGIAEQMEKSAGRPEPPALDSDGHGSHHVQDSEGR